MQRETYLHHAHQTPHWPEGPIDYNANATVLRKESIEIRERSEEKKRLGNDVNH